MPLHVFSWKCEHGRCGMKTAIIDAVGNQLRVGDIVATATIDEHGICSFHGLSVVFDDRPKETSTGPFIMGLYDVDFSTDNNGWYIHRVKKWEDVVEGEHWEDFGFNYKIVDETLKVPCPKCGNEWGDPDKMACTHCVYTTPF